MRNKLAVITEAASILGGEFCRQLASQNNDLILCSTDSKILGLLKKEITSQYEVSVTVLELGSFLKKDISKIVKTVKAKKGLDLLVNSASFGISIPALNADPENFFEMVEVNVQFLMMLTHRLLPEFKNTRNTGILNIASISGFFPAPEFNVYAASQAFIRYFSEALHMELKFRGINVSCLCPETRLPSACLGMPEISENEKERIVRAGLAGIKKNRRIIVPDFANVVKIQLSRIIPSCNSGIFSELMRKNHR